MQQSTFNSIAATYDVDFTYSKIGIMQRNRVWNNLKKDLNTSNINSVLEINCGTGLDAYWLVEKGYSVTATDVSSEMIFCAKQKRLDLNSENPNFSICGFDDLEATFQGRKFDLLFSNFAGLNCINKSELEKLNRVFNSLLNQNGLLIMVLLGKKSWLERLYFLLKGDLKKSKRRLHPDLAKLNEDSFQMTYCYTVEELKEIFTNFNFIRTKPIGIIIPPSYLEPILKKLSFLSLPILLLEKLFGSLSFLSDYADHTYLAFRKK